MNTQFQWWIYLLMYVPDAIVITLIVLQLGGGLYKIDKKDVLSILKFIPVIALAAYSSKLYIADDLLLFIAMFGAYLIYSITIIGKYIGIKNSFIGISLTISFYYLMWEMLAAILAISALDFIGIDRIWFVGNLYCLITYDWVAKVIPVIIITIRAYNNNITLKTLRDMIE